MNEETSDLGPVRATIVVTADRVPPGPMKETPAWRRMRTLLAFGVLALAAGVAVAVGLTSARSAPRTPAPASVVMTVDRDPTMFGVQVDCPRLTIVSPDGQYARADYEQIRQETTPCGSVGNYVTLILHRQNGSWTQELTGAGWRCPNTPLPRRVLVELELCPRPVGGRAVALSRSAPGSDRLGGLSTSSKCLASWSSAVLGSRATRARACRLRRSSPSGKLLRHPMAADAAEGEAHQWRRTTEVRF